MIKIRGTKSGQSFHFVSMDGRLEEPHNSARQIRVFVPYTTPRFTRAALTAASALAKDLRAGVMLFAVRVVPFPLPLDRPDVPTAWLERKLAAIGCESSVPIEIKVALSRDRDVALRHLLEHGSLVVMAAKKTWWPTVEGRLARSLSRAGHSVAMVDI